MKCMICSIIEGKRQILVIEVGYFEETCWSEKKTIVASIGIVVGDWYYNKKSTHAKNERLYIGRDLLKQF